MLNVMSLNCNYSCEKHGPWEERLHLIKSMILENQPHVAAFQAVLHEKPGQPDQKNQSWQIADLTGFRYRLFASVHEEENGDRKGQAMISRIPFHFSDSRQLTRRPDQEDASKRIILAADVPTKKGALHIFNVHFSWVREQSEDNIRETMSFLKKFKGMGLVVGDFNMTQDSDLLDAFRKDGWVDVWQSLRESENGFTFESHEPSRRIDYAWANPRVQEYLQDIKILQNRSRDGFFRMSDHLALMVTLNLPVS